ncbi:T9SS type A sorting domain-containing protein [Ekhidna sp.]
MGKKLFPICAFVLIANFTFAQSAPIVIDGLFDDWTSNLATYSESSESIDGIDLLEFQVTNDEDYLFLKIKANAEFDLTENHLISHEIGLFIDGDNDAATGFASQEGYGTELGLLFYDLFAHYNVPEYSQVSMNDLQMQVAPTVTSDEFEIAIRRDVIPDGQYPLFTSSTIKILFKNDINADALPVDGEVFSYTFDDTPVTPYTPITLEKNEADDIRFLAYNTLFNGLEDEDRIIHFERIIKAINPDIMGFVESGVSNLSNIKSMFDSWLDTEDPNGWYTEINGGELIVSRWPIIKRWDLERQFPALIDLPDEYEMDIVFTNAHLSCCSNEDSRQNQADQYAKFVLDLKSGGEVQENTPFVYSGDLNLVGLAQPLNTLLEGDIVNTSSYGSGGPLDWDDSDLKELNALHTEARLNYTWRSDDSPFPPGKLDFFIYSDYTLSQTKSFILLTESMPTETLANYGLQAGDSFGASDHLPVVSDFQIKPNLNVLSASRADDKKLLVYPNPVEDLLNIRFEKEGIYQVQIYSSIGAEVVNTTVKGHKASINTNQISKGHYIVKISNQFGKKASLSFVKD